MKKVTLEPTGDTTLVRTGTFLLPALLAKDLKVQMSCGGNGICSTCHVRVRAGAENLSPPEAKERRTLALVADADSTSRLACQTRVHGEGVIVHVPRAMYLERADDLLSLLGMRAPENILHPIRGHVLIPKGKIITRTMLEQSRSLDDEVRRVRESSTGKTDTATGSSSRTFSATGTGIVPTSAVFRVATPKSPPPPTPALKASETDLLIETSTPESKAKPEPKRESSPSLVVVTIMPSRELCSTQNVSVSAFGPSSSVLSGLAPSSRAKPLPTTGERVGKCLLLDSIGSGGTGQVFRALHTTLNIPVAVKFLTHFSHEEDGLVMRQFRSEARLLAQLNHPNVVRILDFEDDPAQPYVVMEYVEGLSVSDLIQQSGRIRAEKSLRLLKHVVHGLHAALEVGIIHRDVKPANIIVARDGVAKLVDLGLAMKINGSTSMITTRQGILEGSVAYMSPEQAMSPASVDHRSDIYSLGVSLFQMLTGQLPYRGRGVAAMLAQHLHAPIPLAHESAPEIDPQLSTLVARMMAKESFDRPSSYEELMEQLEETTLASSKSQT